MPAKSPAQRRLAGMALAEKRGEDTGSAAAKRMAGSMTAKQLRDFTKKPKKGK